MHFIANKISVGKTKSFEEICQKFLEEKNANVKTAAVKVAEADEAPSSGQLAVEPLHQEGESTNQDSVAGGKDNDGGKGGKAKTTPSDEEGKDSGQPKAEGSEKLTNDPKVEASAGTKVARNQDGTGPDGEGPRTGRGSGPCEENKEDEGDKDTKEAGSLPEALKEHQFKAKDDKDDDKDEDKDEKTKEASTTTGFKKIANLTPAEKTRLDKYWKTIYPDAFVDALLADK